VSATILIIEDNEQNRYLAAFLLVKSGYRVVEAADGPTGLALAADRPPGLILLDIQLPRMDGYEVARRLRDQPALRQVPIVACTSYAMPGDRQKALAAGCDGYLEKPIDSDTFVAQVAAALRQPGKEEVS